MFGWFYSGSCAGTLGFAPVASAADELGLRGALAAEAQACWAAASFSVTLVSLLVSVVALVALFISLRQTRKALSETRDLGQRQARAYVEAVALELSIDDGDVVVMCQNSGETPSPFFAVGVEARRVQINTIGQALKVRPPVVPHKSWAALGKGSQWPAKVTPDSGSQDVRDLRIRAMNENERLLVTGVIIYEDIFGRFFRTEFAFFTHTGLAGQFLRPNGFLAAYNEIERSEVSKLFNIPS